MGSQDTTLPRRAAAASAPAEFGLRLLMSPDAGQLGKLRRLVAAGLQLGRGETSSASAWALMDPMASRKHAEVSWDDARDCFVVRDPGSRNGTRLNGREVTHERLATSDILRIGDSVLRVEQLDPLLRVNWTPHEESLLRGASAPLQRLLDQVAKVAETSLSVLISGETGSGKDVVARELHRLSGRTGEYVALNCAAMVESLVESELFGHRKGAFSGATEDREGLFRQAHGGTLFLDEVGELSAAAQAKLLRVLEDGEVRAVGGSRATRVDVRLVCASHRDLGADVDDGRFRGDLYARLDQWRLAVPPLRERPDDLLPIVALVIERANGVPYRLSADAFEALALYPWPYNVRELIAVMRKCMVRLPEGGTITRAHLEGDIALPPLPISAAGAEGVAEDGPQALAALPPPGSEPTRAELVTLLTHFGGRVSEAARYLEKGRTQVYRWLEKHDIDPSAYRGSGRPSDP